MKDKFLPLGSVVLLKGGTKKIMINGYCIKTSAKKYKVFDYRGCPFPEGVFSSGVALFNHNDIEKVLFEGYKNGKAIKFLDTLKNYHNI